MSAHNIRENLFLTADLGHVLDPGDAGTFVIEQNLGFCPLVSGGSETRTLGAPAKQNVYLLLYMKTDGGDITVTVTGGFDEAGNTTLVFSDTGDMILLVSVEEGSNYRWRTVAHDGVTGPAQTLLDLNGVADALILDADGDTTISAPTDDQIDIEIAGADDFTFTTGAFNVLSGSIIDFNGIADSLVLDADGDTTISAPSDDQIDIEIGGSDDFTFTANAFNVLTGSAIAGPSSTFVPLVPLATQQALSGAGAVNVTSYYTAWTTTGADAGTLADGVVKGQLKKIQMVADSDDGTLTPANFTDGTTITFADVGDYVILAWDGSGWTALEVGNDADGISGPAIA